MEMSGLLACTRHITHSIWYCDFKITTNLIQASKHDIHIVGNVTLSDVQRMLFLTSNTNVFA